MPLTSNSNIDDRTRLVGVIGQPQGNWPSPLIYNASFDALGLNWRYVPLKVAPKRLCEALAGLRALGFAGADVAEPYQQEVCEHLEQLSPAAETIGAANFVQIDERGRLVGDNTRWCSFLGELHAQTRSLNELRPLVIGAGNTAHSIVYALAREGLPITIVSPDIDRAIELVHRLRHVLDEHSFSVYRWPQDVAQVASKATLIVNTNAIKAWPNDLTVPAQAMVFDLSDGARGTEFLQHARDTGATATGGLSLRVYEAALAFERWTGQTPPLEVMFQIAGELAERAPRGPYPGQGIHEAHAICGADLTTRTS